MNDSNNKRAASEACIEDKNNTTRKLLARISIGLVLCGSLLLVMGASLHELFGIVSPVFFVTAIVLLVRTQQGKIRRSSVYTTASIITGFAGVLFLILGLYVHPVFGYGNLLFYYAAFFISVISVAIIISSGEILKISGVVKILLLVIIGIMIGRFVVVTLEGVRQESRKAHVPQVQTKTP